VNERLTDWKTEYQILSHAFQEFRNAWTQMAKELAEVTGQRDKLRESVESLANKSQERVATFDQLHTDLKAARENNSAGDVEVVNMLRRLLDAFKSDPVIKHQQKWPGEVFRAIQDAEEMLSKIDAPTPA